MQVVLPGGMRTAIWEKAGIDIINALPPEMLMDPDDTVDAAVVALDEGEGVTIPSLRDLEDWERYEAGLRNIGPKLSLAMPAPRYRRRRKELARDVMGGSIER